MFFIISPYLKRTAPRRSFFLQNLRLAETVAISSHFNLLQTGLFRSADVLRNLCLNRVVITLAIINTENPAASAAVLSHRHDAVYTGLPQIPIKKSDINCKVPIKKNERRFSKIFARFIVRKTFRRKDFFKKKASVPHETDAASSSFTEEPIIPENPCFYAATGL